ncbi:hypothetical protein SAMN05421738_110108 [Algoriella xinjiangensis]|uniref:Outer membrane protein beta-barrel domain-containing protein n=1 Tax=Algoriella xinjiangensis TaxID=684065 RepID=A0A1I4Y3Z0_9FLAO|nr:MULTISPECIES: outer membrane beta-barrel protein [Algoriella]MBO6212720.1 outer membrane beta-barrel protein [Algoriella sp.]SFN32801.1 hypothetical protein SAMN05421738_110108 [Algoriella xinjiangensis]VDH15296.1 Uncharacterised protein [Algoriella xinjiangensis]
MKKIILAIIAIPFSMIAFGQDVTTPQTSANVGSTPIKEGNWLVGGSIGSLGYSFEGENFNINLSPQAGYFISDGFAVGLTTGFGLQTVKDHDNIYQYKLMPFARYYFPEGASSTGRFFGQGEVGITGAKSGGVSDTSFGFGVNAGYAHFITRNVALEGMLGYNYSKSNLANAEAQNGLGLAVGLQIYLGHK